MNCFRISVLTVQLLQQGPLAHCASFFSLQVIGSQQGSTFWHSSNEPQSHSSLSSTILLPQCRFSSSCEAIAISCEDVVCRRTAELQMKSGFRKYTDGSLRIVENRILILESDVGGSWCAKFLKKIVVDDEDEELEITAEVVY